MNCQDFKTKVLTHRPEAFCGDNIIGLGCEIGEEAFHGKDPRAQGGRAVMKMNKRPGYTLTEVAVLFGILFTMLLSVVVLGGGSYIAYHFLMKVW